MFNLVTDNSFDLNNTKEYHLSIQVNLDGFSFFIKDPTTKQLLAFEHKQLRISNENFVARRVSEWLEEEKVFSHNYKKTEVIYWSKEFALVPDNWCEKEHSGNLFELIFDKNTDEPKAVNRLSALNKSILFTIPQHLQDVLINKFPDCSIYHPLKKISQNLPELHHKNGSGLVLVVSKDYFYLLLYNKKDILLMNQYPFSHANDVVYYTLSVLKQFEIHPKQTELLLSGAIRNDDKITDALKPYFDSTNFLSPITSIHFNPIWFDGSEHRFVALY